MRFTDARLSTSGRPGVLLRLALLFSWLLLPPFLAQAESNVASVEGISTANTSENAPHGLEAAKETAQGLKSLTAVKAAVPPRVDGVLDESLWASAPAGDGFVQREPDDGKPSTQRTQVQVAFDDSNVYVAGHLWDSVTRGVTCRLTRRDRDSESDWFGVLLDSFHDRKTARMFMVNASGVQRDATVANDSQMDDSWDGVWESAIQCTDTGWNVELRIPLSALRFTAIEDATWGFNAIRYISRVKEQSWWNPVGRTSGRMVSAAGELTGLSTARPPLRLAVMPYAASNISLDSDGAGSVDALLRPNIGLDLQYGLTSDMTLDLTVNPDFGQVEVDQAVIRLTAFQPFFPEKRPFFLEGADILSTVGVFGDDGGGTRMFYSRRIGLDMPILGAAKVSGRSSGGLSVGFLDAVTGFSIARELDPNLSDAPTDVVNYAVARVRQDVGSSSYVGAIATAVSRPEALGHDAYTGALDAIFRTDDGKYSVSALLAGSSLTGSPEHPDVPSQGAQGLVIASKDAGESLVGAASYSFVTRDFQVNDLGYNQRVDQHGGWTWFQYRRQLESGPLREFRINQNSWLFRQLSSGLSVGLGGNANLNGRLRNYWNFYAGVGLDAAAFDPYEVETGGHLYLRPTIPFAYGGFSSDSRKNVVVGLSVNGNQDFTGGSNFSFSPYVELRLGSQGELSVGSSISGGHEQLEWAYTEDNGQPVFGRRNYLQLDSWTRGSVTFTDKLSLQFFGQLLAIEGIYGQYQALLADGTLGTYSPSCGGECPDPNFNVQYFNTNAILRWEYRPGSTLYAVWTQSRELSQGEVSASLGEEVAANFRHGANNSFLLKLNYRWGT